MRLGVVGAAKRDEERRHRLRTTLAALVGSDDVDVVEADSHAALLQLFTHDALDLAWLTPAMVVEAARRIAIGLIATSVRLDHAEYRGAIVVARSSGLSRIDDLRGRSAGWVDPWSAAGYLFPRRALRSSGAEPSDWFVDQRFYGSHPLVADAVVRGEIDLGAVYDPSVVVGRGGDRPDSLAPFRDGLRVILRTDPIPADALCVSHRIGPESLALLAVALFGRQSEQLANLLDAEAFVEGSLDHYRPVREALDDEWGRSSTDPPPYAP